MRLTPLRLPASTRARNLLLIAGLVGFLAGCVGLPVLQPRTASLANRAAEQSAAGNPHQAAMLYAQAAKAAAEPRRSRFFLQAGEAAYRDNDPALAAQMLAAVNASALNGDGRARLNLDRLRGQLANLPPDQALQRVPPPKADASPDLAQRTWGLRSDLQLRAGHTIAAVHALVQRGESLQDPAAIKTNDYRIWKLLKGAPNAGNNHDALAQTDAITRGWVELGAIGNRAWSNHKALTDALAAWEQRYPRHPATRHVLPEQFDYTPTTPYISGGGARNNQAVGLALPLSGNFAAAAAAVRDGFLAAYYRQPAPRPDLHVYDTNAQPDMATLLQQAQADGVGVLVGPLKKDRVAGLATRRAPQIPVLALNYADTRNRFPGFYQFGLAPEDEARAAAQRAIAEGWSQGLALVPEGPRGTRVLQAFRDAMHYAGGQMVDYARFDPGKQDHAEPIKQLLRYHPIHKGEPRTDIDGNPIERGRRHDAQFLFLAAQPGPARSIRTQLRFYHATKLPVLATPDVYAGHPNPRFDRDLDGVIFAHMPWILDNGNPNQQQQHRQIRKQWPEATGHYPRLFAMGLDAWRLATQLRTGGLSPGNLFPGATGRLYLQPDGQIRRGLEWAQFVQGNPKPVPTLTTQIQTPAASTQQSPSSGAAARPTPTAYPPPQPFPPAAGQPNQP